jgi:superfamily I DNA and/or RNA helicase
MSKNQQQKDWYKKTLEKIDNIMSSDKDIADKYLEIYKYTRTALDGEPTTADEHNTMQEDEKLVYEEDFGETRNAQHFSDKEEKVK